MRTYVLLCGVLLMLWVSPVAAQTYPPALGPGFYDQTNPLIEFGGASWSEFSDSNLFGGTNYASGQVSHTDHYIRFSIWGDGIGFYTNPNTNGGEQQICIYSHSTEEEICTTFNTWSSTSLVSVRIEILGFGPGIHTIEVRKATTAIYNLNMDALHVLPPVPEPIDPNAITVEIGDLPPPAWIDLLESDERTAAFDYSVTAGDVGLGVLLLAGFILQSVLVLLKIREDEE